MLTEWADERFSAFNFSAWVDGPARARASATGNLMERRAALLAAAGGSLPATISARGLLGGFGLNEDDGEEAYSAGLTEPFGLVVPATWERGDDLAATSQTALGLIEAEHETAAMVRRVTGEDGKGDTIAGELAEVLEDMGIRERPVEREMKSAAELIRPLYGNGTV